MHPWILGTLALLSGLTCPTRSPAPQLAKDPIPVEIVSLARDTVRTDWCTVAVPAALVPQGARSGALKQREWPVVVGRRLGDHTVLVHVHSRGIRPGEQVTDAVEFSVEPPKPFAPDPWAKADALVPWPVLVLPNPEGGERPNRHLALRPADVEPTVVHEDGAERVTLYQARFDDGASPLFWRVWLYQYRGSPVARWDLQLVHSDSRSQALYADVSQLRIRSDARHLVDHGYRLGAGPLQPIEIPRGVQWQTTLLSPVSLADGVRPTWTGISVSAPEEADGEPPTRHPQHHVRIETARAAFEGPLVGCVGRGVWNGHWLALGRTPQVPGGQEPWAAAAEVHRQWRELASRRGSYWDDRPLGMAKEPGRTGSQPNHGVVRGGEVVSTGCPLPLDGYAYRITTHLRPQGYYDGDMELVRAADHPHWRTWQGRTFVRDEFQDSLNKPTNDGDQIERPSTAGWLAADEQHYGHLDLYAYYALTGRMWARQSMAEQVEVWLAAFHEMAGRAVGRAWLDMATVFRLTGDPRIPAHIVATYEAGMAGWQDRVGGPIKCWPRFTDPRALRDADGEPVDSAVVWQIGLMVPGLDAAVRITGNEAIAETLRLNVEALIRCGWFRDPRGQWLEVDYWWFRDGQPTDPADYGADGNVVGRTHRTGWFGDWVAYATLLGTEVLEGEFRDRAEAIAEQRYKAPPEDWVASQWRLLRP